jgi:hypothetical protein
MKSGTSLWLVIAVAAITILTAGCSPTGWAVREVPDGSNLKPGENVTVIQRDGSVITGEYIGPTTIPSAEYTALYDRVGQSPLEGNVLPGIGQTVQFSTILTDTKSWTGQLVGFDLANIWLRFPGKTGAEPIYFSSISSLSDGNGGVIDRMKLRGMFLNGDIPLMSALKIKNGSREVAVPISSVRELVAGAALSSRTINGSPIREWYIP